jgi:thiosulfate reductase cytochrome b subunit
MRLRATVEGHFPPRVRVLTRRLWYAGTVKDPKPLVYRHSLGMRFSHALGALAFFVLVLSGLQIFNAAPYLDASDKSDPARRVLSIGAYQDAAGKPVGQVEIGPLHITTTHVLGYTDAGDGTEGPRAFPAWITLPGSQSLADGRRWHLFFGWFLTIAGAIYFIAGVRRHDLGLIVLRPSDIPKLLPMQLYYLRLRKDPPPYGKYNPLQKLAYTLVLFVFSPMIVISGLILSPGIDAMLGPFVVILGGRQFARLWHFIFTIALTGFFVTHMILVFSTGAFNNLRSIVTGKYRLGKHEGVGV